MDINLQKMTMDAADVSGMGLIGMRVLDLTLDTMTDTGADLINMINAVPSMDPSAPSPIGVMSADHIDLVV